MELEALANFLMRFPETTEEQPFRPAVDVYKVAGKMFAIMSPEETPARISLKCEPSLALELRAEYPAVTPGYHLNKTHWNTVMLDGSISDRELKDMVAHSYGCVIAGLPKKQRGVLSSIDWPMAKRVT